MAAIDLIKQQSLDADPKTIRQIKFNRNIHKQEAMLFIIEEAKETILDFHKELWVYCEFILP